jgi:hypothetical protein
MEVGFWHQGSSSGPEVIRGLGEYVANYALGRVEANMAATIFVTEAGAVREGSLPLLRVPCSE